MKRIKYIFAFIFLFTSLCFAQLTVQDQESSPNTLLQVVDEGTSGSVILPPLSSITDPSGKLYNLGSVLYWGSTALGSSGSAGGWTSAAGKIYNTPLTDNVGIGTNTPTRPLSFNNNYGDKISIWGQTPGGNILGFGNQPALFQMYTNGVHADIAFGYGQSSSFTENMRIKGNGNVGIGSTNPLSVLNLRTKNYWGPTIGDGWGDFSISDGTAGFAIGMAEFGGGAGDIRMWTQGGMERLIIGNATDGDILAIKDGKVGIGTLEPDSELEVNGQVKITGGSPGAGKVLTSDASGLATWEDNGNSKVGFYGKLSTDIIFPNVTETQLTNFIETFDDGAGFDPAAGVYTITSDGVYHFDIKIRWDVASGSVTDVPVTLRIKNGTSILEQYEQKVTLGTYNEDQIISSNLILNSNDKITFYVIYASASPLNVDYGNGSVIHTYVSGFKIY